MNKPNEIRAINRAMEQYIAQNPTFREDKKNSPGNLLRSYGYIHAEINPEIREMAMRYAEESAEALSNLELCSYNNWFRMHPEKVAGIEKITTSINFPLTIEGDKEDVLYCLEKGLNHLTKTSKIPELLQKESELLTSNPLTGFQRTHKPLELR